jgi:hypothetical protein
MSLACLILYHTDYVTQLTLENHHMTALPIVPPQTLPPTTSTTSILDHLGRHLLLIRNKATETMGKASVRASHLHIRICLPFCIGVHQQRVRLLRPLWQPFLRPAHAQGVPWARHDEDTVVMPILLPCSVWECIQVIGSSSEHQRVCSLSALLSGRRLRLYQAMLSEMEV